MSLSYRNHVVKRGADFVEDNHVVRGVLRPRGLGLGRGAVVVRVMQVGVHVEVPELVVDAVGVVVHASILADKETRRKGREDPCAAWGVEVRPPSSRTPRRSRRRRRPPGTPTGADRSPPSSWNAGRTPWRPADRR